MCRDIPPYWKDKVILYVYRNWPVYRVRVERKNKQMSLSSQIIKLPGEGLYKSIDEFKNRWGSGTYTIKLNEQRFALGTMWQCQFSFREMDTHPPVIEDYASVVWSDPENRDYIEFLRRTGKWQDVVQALGDRAAFVLPDSLRFSSGKSVSGSGSGRGSGSGNNEDDEENEEDMQVVNKLVDALVDAQKERVEEIANGSAPKHESPPVTPVMAEVAGTFRDMMAAQNDQFRAIMDVAMGLKGQQPPQQNPFEMLVAVMGVLERLRPPQQDMTVLVQDSIRQVQDAAKSQIEAIQQQAAAQVELAKQAADDNRKRAEALEARLDKLIMDKGTGGLDSTLDALVKNKSRIVELAGELGFGGGDREGEPWWLKYAVPFASPVLTALMQQGQVPQTQQQPQPQPQSQPRYPVTVQQPQFQQPQQPQQPQPQQENLDMQQQALTLLRTIETPLLNMYFGRDEVGYAANVLDTLLGTDQWREIASAPPQVLVQLMKAYPPIWNKVGDQEVAFTAWIASVCQEGIKQLNGQE